MDTATSDVDKATIDVDEATVEFETTAEVLEELRRLDVDKAVDVTKTTVEFATTVEDTTVVDTGTGTTDEALLVAVTTDELELELELTEGRA